MECHKTNDEIRPQFHHESDETRGMRRQMTHQQRVQQLDEEVGDGNQRIGQKGDHLLVVQFQKGVAGRDLRFFPLRGRFQFR